MVRFRIISPCSSSSRSTKIPPPLRRTSSSSTSTGNGALKVLGFAFFIFATTTYLVFSLDMLMVKDDEDIDDISSPKRNLETTNPQTNLVLRKLPSQEIETHLNDQPSSEQQHRFEQNDPSYDEMVLAGKNEFEEKPILDQQQQIITNSPHDDFDFVDGLNSIGLALRKENMDGVELLSDNNQQDDVEGEDPPQPSENDEDDDGTNDDVIIQNEINNGNGESNNLENIQGTLASSVDWKRLHNCKYGKSEKSPNLSYNTWIWRHKKGAIQHDEYTRTPSEAKLKRLKYAIQLMSDSVLDLKNAISVAAEAGYTLCKIDLETNMVIAWQPRIRGDALIFTRYAITNNGHPSPLIVEAPHAQYDHTLNQALYVFSETRAKALILSESHRCSRSLANKCTGNEGEPIRNVCSGSGSSARTFHNSDVAHAIQNVFHAAHEQLAVDYPTYLFASLHSAKGEEFVISDGTSGVVTTNSPLVLFAKKLAEGIPTSPVGVCNDIQMTQFQISNLENISNERRIVCGATNVQGRQLNGATDPCRQKIHRSGAELKASGRFLHIEQPVELVTPRDSKSTKPIMSKPLSEALLAACQGIKNVS